MTRDLGWWAASAGIAGATSCVAFGGLGPDGGGAALAAGGFALLTLFVYAAGRRGGAARITFEGVYGSNNKKRYRA